MLVLSRKAGERIQIGGRITISVIALRGGKVRIGIEAPREVPVVRAELGDFYCAPHRQDPVAVICPPK